MQRLMKSLANLDNGGRRSRSGGETGLPLNASTLLPDLEDTSIHAPEGGDGSLAAALVVVVSEGHDLLDGLLDIGLEVVHVARVGNDIAEDVKGNLLLHGNGGGAASEVGKILNVIPVILTLADINVLGVRGLDLDTLAADNEVAVLELAGVNAGNVQLLVFQLQGREDALEDTVKEVLELLVVDLGKVGPEDEARLLESGVVQAEGFLAGLHEIHDVGLEGLRANSQGNAAQTVAGGASQVHGVLAVLDHDKFAEGLHHVLEVGLEVLLHGGGDGTEGRGSGGLDAIVIMVKQLDHRADKRRAVLSHDLGVNAVAKGVESTAGAADDADIGLVRRTLRGRLEVLQDSLDDLLVVGSHLIGHLLGEVNEANKGGVSDLEFGVAQQVDDGGEERLELGRDEVRSTLGSVAESQHGGHAVAGVLVGGEDGELLKQRHNDLARRQLVGQLVNQADGDSGGRHVLLVIRVEVDDDVHGLDHELGANILHGLNLHAAERDGLDEEAKSLGARIVLGVGVAGQLNHEHEQVAQVEGQKGRVIGNEGVEHVKNGAVALLVASLNGSLKDVDQAGDKALHGLEGLGVLLGVDEHENGTNGADNVHADLLAVVVDARLEQLEELIGVVAEVRRVVLEHGIEDERANLTVHNVVAGVEGQQLLQEVLAIARLHVLANDASNQARQRVAVGSGRLLQGALEQVRAHKRLLVLGGGAPELGDEAQGLDGGQLANGTVSMCKGDLDERQKRLGLGVVVLLEIGCDGLDLFRVGCRGQTLAEGLS
ncbi:hypothetical protein MKX07_005182 [Trichoderma sp. CBMAI-0711]|nr:hypothetical protein MKX07_005182 [Trichoderma sp. CBMAI-0711]